MIPRIVIGVLDIGKVALELPMLIYTDKYKGQSPRALEMRKSN